MFELKGFIGPDGGGGLDRSGGSGRIGLPSCRDAQMLVQAGKQAPGNPVVVDLMQIFTKSKGKFCNAWL